MVRLSRSSVIVAAILVAACGSSSPSGTAPSTAAGQAASPSTPAAGASQMPSAPPSPPAPPGPPCSTRSARTGPFRRMSPCRRSRSRRRRHAGRDPASRGSRRHRLGIDCAPLARQLLGRIDARPAGGRDRGAARARWPRPDVACSRLSQARGRPRTGRWRGAAPAKVAQYRTDAYYTQLAKIKIADIKLHLPSDAHRSTWRSMRMSG